MIIVMKADASEHELGGVLRAIGELGLQAHPLAGPTRTAIGITGNQGPIDALQFESMSGVIEVIHCTEPYELITLSLRPERTVVRVGDAAIGDGDLTIIAGACGVESRAQLFSIAESVRQSGASFFYAGAFKPRTSPYVSPGPGEEGLKALAEVRDVFGLKIVSEAVDMASVDLVERYADVIQLGARNMQNFSLLRRLGHSRLPVLLERGFWATVDEWLLAAEYILAGGNYNVVLCERGIRTFGEHTRSTLDLSSVPAVRMISHLPVVVDPSHGSGSDFMVTPLARAAVAVGSDGLVIELNDRPGRAHCDDAQALTIEQYHQLVKEARAARRAVSRLNSETARLAAKSDGA